MLRAILGFFGFLFSWLVIGSVMALGVLAGVFYIYGRDLPDHAQLARYEPATLSRISMQRSIVPLAPGNCIHHRCRTTWPPSAAPEAWVAASNACA